LKKLTVLKVFMRRRFIKDAILSVLAFAMVLAAPGCGKKAAQAPPAPTPTPTAETPTQPAAAPQQPQAVAQPAAPANGSPDLDAVNRTLIRWVVGHKRRPANFEEFAATAGAPIPPPPAGKKYIIAANMHVELVNQ
jgi:hypothetical protein